MIGADIQTGQCFFLKLTLRVLTGYQFNRQTGPRFLCSCRAYARRQRRANGRYRYKDISASFCRFRPQVRWIDRSIVIIGEAAGE